MIYFRPAQCVHENGKELGLTIIPAFVEVMFFLLTTNVSGIRMHISTTTTYGECVVLPYRHLHH